jgi:23S rRNA G2445 N2-methylase RlmL
MSPVWTVQQSLSIASEGHVSIEQQRHFVGIELKRSYYEQACRNLQAISVGTKAQLSLLDTTQPV